MAKGLKRSQTSDALGVLQRHLLPHNAFITVQNRAGSRSSRPPLSPAPRPPDGRNGADETRHSLLPSVPSCGASSDVTQPSHGFGGSHSSEGFPLTPTCKAVFLSAEAAARQVTEKTHFFRACFPSYTASLQLNSDFVPLQALTDLCCPYTLGSLHAPRGKLQMEDP